MKRIPLTRGQFAIVDDSDYAQVVPFKWYAYKRRGTFYAARTVRSLGRRTTLHMHVFIMCPPEGSEVHHKNENGLDNRRSKNLQVVTHSEHKRFKSSPATHSSGFRGVYWSMAALAWQTVIKSQGVRYYLGLFDSAKEAAQIRDAKARELGWPEEGMNFPKSI